MKKDLYTPEVLFKLGQIYQSLLYVLNDRGHKMSMRMSWVQGTMKYQELLKTHPLKKQRKKLKLTQEELAEKIGVTQKDISRWENYMHKPSQENLQKLAEALDCTVDDIIE